jgi:hypothetical protein|tara:strand:- start:506 stop:730 length:225 start_codon:yes stop_codon:yes gene_type:complete
MFEIVAIMFMVLGSKEIDAVRITHDQGKPLTFKTQQICYAHVYANLEKIKEFASSQFDGRPVKSVICAPVPKEV